MSKPHSESRMICWDLEELVHRHDVFWKPPDVGFIPNNLCFETPGMHKYTRWDWYSQDCRIYSLEDK